MKRRPLVALAAFGVCLAVAQPAAAYSPDFNDGTAGAGLPIDAHTSWGSAIADVNGDGWADVLLNRHTQRAVLYLGGPGGFTQDTDLTFPWPMDRHNCSWGEANGDGRPDLLCAQGAQGGAVPAPNELWINTPDGFVESAADYGLQQAPWRGRTATWIDYDHDGDLDIFFGSAPNDGYPDVMFRNDGGTFTRVDVGLEAKRDTESATWADWDGNGYPDLLLTSVLQRTRAFTNDGSTFSAVTIPALGTRVWYSSAWGDFNGDGKPDLAVADPHMVRIMRNDSGTFTKVLNLKTAYSRGLTWGDFNNDGRLDLYVVRSAKSEDPGTHGDKGDLVFLANSSGGFTKTNPAELTGWTGSGDGVSALDYDHDGRMDLLVTNGRSRWPGAPVLLHNVLATQNAAAIRLRGTDWNPLGFGTTIHVQSSDLSYYRETNDGVTWNGQSDAAYVHLGLGADTAANAIVTWADGTEDCVLVNAGDVVELQIGTSPCG